MVYCINSSLLLHTQQKPTGKKRGPTDERKQTKGINNNCVCLLGRQLITFIFGCWGKQHKPDVHTQIWTLPCTVPSLATRHLQLQCKNLATASELFLQIVCTTATVLKHPCVHVVSGFFLDCLTLEDRTDILS